MSYQMEKEILKKVNVYLEHFSATELNKFEDTIFGEYNRYYRAFLEIQRLKRIFKGEYLIRYRIHELEMMLKDAYFDKDALDDIYKSILKIQLQNGISIRLYGGLSMLKDHLELFS